MPTARTPAEILEYHRRSVVALRELGRRFGQLPAGDQAAFPKTREAFEEALVVMRDELDDEVVLALVAGAEWLLRGDFEARRDGKDACGRRFRHLVQRFEGKVPLDEILDVWKDLTGASDEIGRVKQRVLYRHGLAHGKVFNKSGLHDATPADTHEVIGDAFDAIHRHATDFPRR
jgi:hypothetical protein